MACGHYGICDLINHIEKMVELEGLPEETKKELNNFLLGIERDFCSGDVMGQNVYYNGVMITIECTFFNVTCCPRFPNCSIVRSKQISSPNNLARLCTKTCTSLGKGKCTEMGKLDFDIMLEGGTDITVSRPVEEKFKGL